MLIITEIIVAHAWECAGPRTLEKKSNKTKKIVEKIDVALDKRCRKTLI